MNILISSAGRRNELIGYFRDSDDVGKIVVCDLDPYAAAFEDCDIGYLAPPITDSGYESFLYEVCRRESVDLVFTLNDFELPILSRMKKRLSGIGTTALVSEPEIIEVCWDKSRSDTFLRESGFSVPSTYSFDEVLADFDAFPLVIKPRFGTASIGVEVANSFDEFEILHRYSELSLGRTLIGKTPGGSDVLIQEKVQGQEYAVDIVNDLDGEFQGCVVKKKLGIRGGDADCVVSVFDTQIEDWCREFSKALRHVANVDCDLIRNDDGIFCVDINPRFGGAYPFSHLSGVNLPEMILSWAKRAPAPNAFGYAEGVITARTERYLVLSKTGDLKKLDSQD